MVDRPTLLNWSIAMSGYSSFTFNVLVAADEKVNENKVDNLSHYRMVYRKLKKPNLSKFAFLVKLSYIYLSFKSVKSLCSSFIVNSYVNIK